MAAKQSTTQEAIDTQMRERERSVVLHEADNCTSIKFVRYANKLFSRDGMHDRFGSVRVNQS